MFWHILSTLFVFFLGMVWILFIGLCETLLIAPRLDRIDKFLASFALGSGTIVTVLFILNQFWGIPLDRTNILSAAVITLLFLVFCCIYRRINLHKEMGDMLKIKKPVIKVILMPIILFYAIAFYKAAFYPVVSWDALSMFVYTAKTTYLTGLLPDRVSSSPFDYGLVYPDVTFMSLLSNFLFAVNGGFDDIFIRLFSPMISILSLLVVYRLALLTIKNEYAAFLSIALLLSCIVYAENSIIEHTTILELFYPILAIYFFALYVNGKDKSLILLSSVLFGFSLTIKYTLIPMLAFFLLYLLVIERDVKTITYVSAFALIVALPYYARNTLYFGNPTYPVIPGLGFVGKNTDNFLAPIIYRQDLIPKYTFHKFLENLIYSGSFVWVFYLLSVFSYFKSVEKNQPHTLLYFISFLFGLFWLAAPGFAPQGSGWRFIAPILPITCLFASSYLAKKIDDNHVINVSLIILTSLGLLYVASVYDGGFTELTVLLVLVIFLSGMFLTLALLLYRSNIVSRQKLFTLMVFAVLLPSLGVASFSKYFPLGAFPSRDDVLYRNMGDLAYASTWINENLPQDARILSFENRRYYIDREIVPADSPDVIFMYENGSVDETLRVLHSMKVNYVMIDPLWSDSPLWNMSSIHREHEKLEENRNIRVLYKMGDITLYEIMFSNETTV